MNTFGLTHIPQSAQRRFTILKLNEAVYFPSFSAHGRPKCLDESCACVCVSADALIYPLYICICTMWLTAKPYLFRLASSLHALRAHKHSHTHKLPRTCAHIHTFTYRQRCVFSRRNGEGEVQTTQQAKDSETVCYSASLTIGLQQLVNPAGFPQLMWLTLFMASVPRLGQSCRWNCLSLCIQLSVTYSYFVQKCHGP